MIGDGSDWPANAGGALMKVSYSTGSTAHLIKSALVRVSKMA